jgi:hypothetical protein
MAQVSIRRKFHMISNNLLEKLRQLRLLANLSLSPPLPDSSGIMRRLLYIGAGDLAKDDVNGVDHPRFCDLGRIQYKVLALLFSSGTMLISKLQKPQYKASPIIMWDESYIPRTLLESDTELLRLLAERARLYTEWEATINS